MTVKEGWRGRFYEDFEVGDEYEHPFGHTVTTTDNRLFTLLTRTPLHSASTSTTRPKRSSVEHSSIRA
jgi:acyl dehydratase